VEQKHALVYRAVLALLADTTEPRLSKEDAYVLEPLLHWMQRTTYTYEVVVLEVVLSYIYVKDDISSHVFPLLPSGPSGPTL
jgi:hypothetical protein